MQVGSSDTKIGRRPGLPSPQKLPLPLVHAPGQSPLHVMGPQVTRDGHGDHR
jgi:hypothetical protein